MKFLVYALSVGALIGSYYSIAAGITYADIACALLLIISSYKFITHQWLTDRFFYINRNICPIYDCRSTYKWGFNKYNIYQLF